MTGGGSLAAIAATLGLVWLAAPASACAPPGGGSPSGGSPASGGEVHRNGSDSQDNGAAERARGNAADAAGAGSDNAGDRGPSRSDPATAPDLSGQIAAIGRAQAADQTPQCAGGPAPETTDSQMCADQLKQQQKRFQILQDTQTRTFEIQQDVTTNRARNQERANQAWEAYVRDGAQPTAAPPPSPPPPPPPHDRGPPT